MASVAAPQDSEPSTVALKALAPRTTSMRVLSLRSVEGIEGLSLDIEGLPTLYEPPPQRSHLLMLHEEMARLDASSEALMAYPRTSNRVFGLVSIEIERERRGKGKGYALYEFPLQGIQDHSSDDYGEVHRLQEFQILLSGSKSGSKAIAVGSKIYVLGGSCAGDYDCIHPGESGEHFLSAVYCLDTLHPRDGWKTCPSMLRPRWLPVVSVVDGKIYVFGGAFAGGFSAEVYDPEKNEWELLPRLPRKIRNKRGGSYLTPINAVVADPDGSNKRILLHIYLNKRLYAFHVDTRSWSCFDPKFYDHPYISQLSPTSAVLDNILYCYSEYDGQIHSYDLILKRWYPVEDIFGLDGTVYCWPSMFLVGGDTLCFLCSGPTTAFGTNELLIECGSCKIKGRFPLPKSSVTIEDTRTFVVGGVSPECFVIL